jgi:hypothetical protein
MRFNTYPLNAGTVMIMKGKKDGILGFWDLYLVQLFHQDYSVPSVSLGTLKEYIYPN